MRMICINRLFRWFFRFLAEEPSEKESNVICGPTFKGYNKSTTLLAVLGTTETTPVVEVDFLFIHTSLFILIIARIIWDLLKENSIESV